jgi:TNF receptor-associated factor 4
MKKILFFFSVVPRCPSCQQPISKEKIVNDNNLQKEIQNFEIYCTYKDKGCDWDGPLRDFPVHIETCGFLSIDCPNACGAKFERRFTDRHQNEDCA